MIKKLSICIAGLGNVGSALVSTIQKNNEIIYNKSNLKIDIVAVSAKNKNKQRDCDISKYEWFDNPIDLINNNKCDVFVELIGLEKSVSFELVKKALNQKIHVVTGNKAMLANYGSELFLIAEQNEVLLLYEAAVAGGIPVIKTIKNNLFLNKIKKISGILNGTTNYILSKMQEDNLSFNEALNIAKNKGFTSDREAELDLGGVDHAHKIKIKKTLSFGADLDFSVNDITGISEITIDDIKYADQLGYRIKLISESSIIDDQLYAVTSPKLIHKNNSISNVNGALNAINIETDQLNNIFLEGEGAGGKATASSIISDLYEISIMSSYKSLGFEYNKLIKYKKFNSLNIESKYFLRIMTNDQLGVLSKITTYFNDSNISVEKIVQIPDNNDEIIPIIISTHKIKKLKLMNAVDKIEKLDFVQKISFIPIE